MKAWLVRDRTDDEGMLTVVFAETAGKAKSIATKTAVCGDSSFTDISVSRLPIADKMYRVGKTEMDWDDPKDRCFLVKNCDFYCIEKSEKICNECNAKKYCYRHESKVDYNDELRK